jgi:hypothetical protein
MIQCIKKIQIIILCLFTLIPLSGFSLEYQAGLLFDEQLSLANNFFDSTSGKFNQSESDNIIVVSPNLYVAAGNKLNLYLLADLFWTHSWDAAETDELDAEFVNAYLTIRKNKLYSDIGIQTFRLGRGHIMASNEPGITFQYQPNNKFFCTFEAARIIDTSPIISTTIGYKRGFLEKMAVFSAWFQDNDNGFADMLNYQDSALTNRWLYSRNQGLWLLSQNDLLNFSNSEGNLFWYGISYDFFLGDIYLSGIMMIETGSGSITLEYPNRVWEFTLSSYLIDMDVSYTVNDSFSISTFLFITGGINDDQRNINTFIAPMPRNDRTSIFFSQHFNDQIEEDFLSKGGIYWAGVIAPGVKINYYLSEKLNTGITLAAFFPEKNPSDERNWYGWEIDTHVSYTIKEKYTLFSEFGFFQHGNFYQYQGRTPDPATKFTMGINTFF